MTATESESKPAPGQKRTRTRAALIAAALEVVEMRGFIAASLDEIATHAGMTKGAIYSNFGSKAELMLAAAQSQAATFAPAYQADATLAVQLQAAAHGVAQMLPAIQKTARLQAQFQLYLQDEPGLREQVSQDLTRGLQVLINQVAKHHAAELAVTPRALILTLQALSLGLAHQSMATPALVDEATISTAFELLASGALRAAPDNRHPTVVRTRRTQRASPKNTNGR